LGMNLEAASKAIVRFTNRSVFATAIMAGYRPCK